MLAATYLYTGHVQQNRPSARNVGRNTCKISTSLLYGRGTFVNRLTAAWTATLGNYFAGCKNWDLKETGLECLDWIALAQDTDKWLAVMNTVPKDGLAEELLASQDVLCFMELQGHVWERHFHLQTQLIINHQWPIRAQT